VCQYFIIAIAYFPAVIVSGNTGKNLQLAKTDTEGFNREFLTQISNPVFKKNFLILEV